MLIARRLIEAGVRVVTVAYGFWDTHGNNFKYLKDHLPLFDKGISALVNDIYAERVNVTSTSSTGCPAAFSTATVSLGRWV